MLCRRWESVCGNRISWQLVIPPSLRPQVLKSLHSEKTSGHLGVRKTLSKLKERFYWMGMGNDVRRFCRSCDICASRKPPPKKARSPMKQYNVGAPLERTAIDVLGPLPVTSDGNKFILVIADYFTKWTEAFPMSNQEATTVAKILVDEFVSRFGTPLQLHSDQGTNFESNVFREMCSLLGVDKTRTTALHPQSDGMVERFNRTLESMLSAFVAENQRDWDKLLPYLMMAYRSSEHETTGVSPVEMMFGRPINLPIDLYLGRPEGEDSQTPLTLQYVKDLEVHLARTHAFARRHMVVDSNKQKRNYDHKTMENKYNRGDVVCLHSPRRQVLLERQVTAILAGPLRHH